MINENKNIDTNLYSRQLGLYGIEYQRKIRELNILIYGMRGLGVEIAKNIILAGPNSVSIYDPNITKINDLTSNFYLTKIDYKNKIRRDEAVIKKLSQLNPHVETKVMKGDNIYENIKKNVINEETKYSVVLISEYIQREEIIKINELCRNNGIGFIYTALLGIYTFCFVDFGDKFYIDDERGEDPLNYCIKSISKGKKGTVKIDTTAGKIKLRNGDQVTFKEIEGMTELNNCNPRNITFLSFDTVEIGDTSMFSDYKSGGIMIEVKIKKEINFKNLDYRFEIPYENNNNKPKQNDFSKNNSNEIVHIGLLSLNKFFKEKNMLPELNNKEHANILISYGKEIYKKKKNENLFWINELEEEMEEEEDEEFFDFYKILEKTLLKLSLWARAEISPLASFMGGISAQEIVKFIGKYRPINQWIWFDFSEAVENLGDNIERKLQNERYDDQIAIFGNKIQEELQKTNIFIIGAGALGCEFMKTFALMGISTKKDNKIIITDNDNIEISNLNRQFLYRNIDIGKSKSIIACNAIKKINLDLNCYAKSEKVGIETEGVFNEKFWESQDYIINAVDNLESRIYISDQSFIFKKILIDSGTLGTIANSQVIIPYKTIKYSEPEKEDDEQERIAMCTLRNYPTLITHCIEWARDLFEGYFIKIINNLKLFYENKEKYYEQLNKEYCDDYEIQSKELEKIIKYSKLIINHNYDDCLEIAYDEYIKKFNNDIIQILTDNPIDSLNEDGTKFWSSNKRPPIPLPFDKKNELIILYIKKYADILANSLSIQSNYSNEYIINKCMTFKRDKFIPIIKNKPKKNRYTLNDEKKQLEKIQRKKDIEKRLKQKKDNFEKIKNYSNDISFQNKILNNFNALELNLDNDNNGHLNFLYAASNLRATNFRIERCDINKVKIIAGKITPAIATTTGGIVGLVSLQLLILKQTKNINYLRNCNIQLSYNNYYFEKPKKCEYENIKYKDIKSIKFIPEEYTIWDFIEIKESMTINNFIEFLKQKYNVFVYSINCNYINLYDSHNKKKNNCDKRIEDIYNEISEQKLFENKTFLILDIFGNSENIEVKMPKIKYIFKN